jgi:hypothetical protein
MQRLGIPPARENWIKLAYLGDPPKEWTQELENERSPVLRKPVKLAQSTSSTS